MRRMGGGGGGGGGEGMNEKEEGMGDGERVVVRVGEEMCEWGVEERRGRDGGWDGERKKVYLWSIYLGYVLQNIIFYFDQNQDY